MMALPNPKPLSAILCGAVELPWDKALYRQGDPEWTAETPCFILDPEIYEDTAEGRQLATDHGLRFVLGTHQIHEIVDNLYAQVGEPSTDELLDALVYYLENDAFKEFDGPDLGARTWIS